MITISKQNYFPSLIYTNGLPIRSILPYLHYPFFHTSLLCSFFISKHSLHRNSSWNLIIIPMTTITSLHLNAIQVGQRSYLLNQSMRAQLASSLSAQIIYYLHISFYYSQQWFLVHNDPFEHTIQYKDVIIELCTRNLYNFINIHTYVHTYIHRNSVEGGRI